MDQVTIFLTSNVSLIVGLVIGVAALVTAFFQWRRSIAEANAFRQQIVSILHHAEGLSTELRTIVFRGPDPDQTFSTVGDVRKAVNAAFQNSEALFFGLLEIKVGGKTIKNDLDKKYAEWVGLNLDQKMGGLRTFLTNNNIPIPVNTPHDNERHLLTDLKEIFIKVKNYLFKK